jgi:hypothetical protein
LDCLSSQAHLLKEDLYTCTLCEKPLPRTSFSASMQKCEDHKRWKCESCTRCFFPPCTSGCGMKRPTLKKKYNVQDMSHWTCMACRMKAKYSPCAGGCGSKRPQHVQKYCVQKQPLWTCAACSEKGGVKLPCAGGCRSYNGYGCCKICSWC